MDQQTSAQTSLLARFDVRLTACIRPAVHEDLEALEWGGMFTDHREIIHRTWEATCRGEAAMLVAEANRFPIGQAWVDFTRYADERGGMVWAVRVIPGFQRLGIGSRLLDAAEALLREAGYPTAEIQVEPSNPAAKRLYEARGYRAYDRAAERLEYLRPDGVLVGVDLDLWRLRKSLVDDREGAWRSSASAGRSAT